MSALLLSYGAGWLITLSPCVLPILPLLLSGAAAKDRYAPLLMAAGLTLSFALLGSFIAILNEQFGLSTQNLRFYSALLLLFAAGLMLIPQGNTALGRLFAPLANKANNLALKLEAYGRFGSLLTGALLGAIWAPCSGPALIAALGLAADASSAGQGFIRLLIFGLGAATPLLIISYGARGLLHKVLKFSSARIKLIFGLCLAMIALLILTGADLVVQEWAVQRLPHSWLLFTTQL
jgi:cytochrome c-type biogenesis protein